MEAVIARFQNIAKYKAREFHLTHGGDLEELRAEALHGVWVAAQTWEEAKGKLNTWVDRCIDYHLRAWMRDLSRWSRTGEPRRQLEQEGTGWLTDFKDSLSEEARTVVELCLDLPEWVQANALDNGGHPYNLSPALQIHLKREMGWTWKQICETWKELKEALN